ncbi:glycosyltransferase family 2 protein [Nocardia mexicana]|uniref:Succinoglycan biosynthesis protein ExoM n=1 Tax=Nocardia mexicana TaxID=279262 RepID=A0A370H3X4_9NOCA|nr:glycosyltransferase family 2 protein [Nocardia mexicana]RDI50899.1 succinoglycan biosynthesis protein ExoM [Nocardia mexicana]
MGTAAAPVADDRLVVVAVATYRRPAGLTALLRSLADQVIEQPIRVVVVDNDPLGSAQGVTSRFAPDAHYAVEARPGIAAARNTALAVALALRPWAIAFIDDDEVADSRWLHALVSGLQRHRADIATGPVRYLVPYTADAEVRQSSYSQTLVRDDGAPVKYVATNNTIVLASWFADSPDLRFDESFSLSGGSDLEFFLRLQESGASSVWVPHAIVTTRLPLQRSTRRWLLRRELRNGQLIARLRMRFDGYSRGRAILVGLLLIQRGTLRSVSGLVVGQGIPMSARYHTMAGIGWLRAALGMLYEEYRREGLGEVACDG